MNAKCDRLRSEVLRVAAAASGHVDTRIGDRPIIVLAPTSEIGKRYVPLLAAKSANVIAVVDDLSTEGTIHGFPRWSLFEFLQRAPGIPGAVAVDFSVSRFASALFAQAAAAAGVERLDCVAAFAEFQLPAVFESVVVTRAMTLERLDRFLALADRFDDDLSRLTLYSLLLLRLDFDRRHLADCLMSGEHEYFSSGAQGQTFQLGDREVFCDAGAHIGLVTCKFLGATHWKYDQLFAFEPDRINYKNLGKLRLLPLHDLHLRNVAISDREETLSFVESGTVSSYISTSGTQTCRTVRLDDELDRITFLKMDIEGFETRALRGAARLVSNCAPRMAITAYHYPWDLLDIVETIDELREGYRLNLRHHYNYFYDTILYASPVRGWGPQ